MIISHSSITTFRQCRQKYQFGYDLNLEALKPDFDLLLGSAVHYALERYYGYKEDLHTSFNQGFDHLFETLAAEYILSDGERTTLSETFLLGCDMLYHYLDFYKEPEFLFMVHEYPFHVSIPNTDGFFEGRVDGVVCDQYGDLWIIEHKTAKTFPDQSYYTFDDQSALYQWAMQQAINAGEIPGIEPRTPLRGYCYNGLRKAIPEKPKLLNNEKEVSVAKITTTYEVYMETLMAYGFSPEEERYRRILASLQQQGNTFFARYWWLRTQYELQMIERELQMVYAEMAREDRLTYRTPSRFSCPRCPFREPCDALQKRGDVEYLLENSFRTRKERQTVEQSVALNEIEVYP